MQVTTSIYIRADLKDQLTSLKHHLKESYNDVIGRLVNLAVDAEPLSEDAIRGLEESREEIRQGMLIPESKILKKYGVE
ncbi:MAG: hypothetical protein STSR0009_03970 [Methanoregula sp.]